MSLPPPNRDLNRLHPSLRQAIEQLIKRCAAELGIVVVVTEGWRSAERQRALYAVGRPGGPPGKILAFKLHSVHQEGRAVDFCPLGEHGEADWNCARWEEIGTIGEELGLVWGGRWRMRDCPHFQLPV